jgi:hypothetical protein
MGTVIDLAAVRAARQAAQAAPAMPPAAPAAAPLAPLHWQQSQRGNWWTRDDAHGGIHFVIFENRRGWSGRVTMPSGQAWFENMPSVSSAEEARDWAEAWLGTHCVPNAAERARP